MNLISKEWARDCVNTLTSLLDNSGLGESKSNYVECLVNYGYINESEMGYDFQAKAQTESEAIFKACEWILKEKQNEL